MKKRNLLILFALPLILSSCSLFGRKDNEENKYEFSEQQFYDATNPTKIILEANYKMDLYIEGDLYYTCEFDDGISKNTKYDLNGEISSRNMIQVESVNRGNFYAARYYNLDSGNTYDKTFSNENDLWSFFFPSEIMPLFFVNYEDAFYDAELQVHRGYNFGVRYVSSYGQVDDVYFTNYILRGENGVPYSLEAEFGSIDISIEISEHNNISLPTLL